mmetsp:Transcript_887/g.2683  ORF Transcript_887/g.2683 Transcript_887/m.2683 type:complete len:204 (+) Transcript_887:531-1142(+)
MRRWQLKQPAAKPLQQRGPEGSPFWRPGCCCWFLPFASWRTSGRPCRRSASRASARSRASMTRPKPSCSSRSSKPEGSSLTTAASTRSARRLIHTTAASGSPTSSITPGGSIVIPKAASSMFLRRWVRPILLLLTQLLRNFRNCKPPHFGPPAQPVTGQGFTGFTSPSFSPSSISSLSSISCPPGSAGAAAGGSSPAPHTQKL